METTMTRQAMRDEIDTLTQARNEVHGDDDAARAERLRLSRRIAVVNCQYHALTGSYYVSQAAPVVSFGLVSDNRGRRGFGRRA